MTDVEKAELYVAMEEMCYDYGLDVKDFAKEAIDFTITYETEMMNAFLCLDCRVHTGEINEYFMVHDDLWFSVNPDGEGMLCLGCLEARLGRPLAAADFTDAPVNRQSFARQSERLRTALGLDSDQPV